MHPLINPVISIVAGICVLVFPNLLAIVVGIYLILTGVLSLSGKRA